MKCEQPGPGAVGDCLRMDYVVIDLSPVLNVFWHRVFHLLVEGKGGLLSSNRKIRLFSQFQISLTSYLFSALIYHRKN